MSKKKKGYLNLWEDGLIFFLPVKLYHGPQFQGPLNTVLELSL